MYSILLTTGAALALTLVLTPLVRDAFLRWGVVDRPDGRRKLHGRAIPRAGGLPIAAAYGSAYLLLLVSPLKGGDYLGQGLPLVWKLMPAALLVLATGLLDDIWGLRPAEKLFGQAAAAVLAYSGGVTIASIAGYAVPEWLGLPLTVLWLAACANAFNLIDGVDGLAAGVGLVATLTIFLAALVHRNLALALATFPLAGCLLGFLRYNFNPASVFLGDSGSLLVGFLLGCYGVIWSQKSATMLGMTAPLMTLALPLADTGLAVVRRFLRGRPIFSADRGHVHHRLLDRGLTPRRVVLLLYAACGLGAALSLLESALHSRYTGWVLVLFLAVAWAGIHKLDYEEFGAAKRLLFGGELRKLLDAQVALVELERAIERARTVESCWAAVQQGCGEFGFSRAELHFNGQVYGRGRMGGGAHASWHVYVPLSERDFLLLSRVAESTMRLGVVSPLADLLRSRLPGKLAALSGSDAASLGSETESLLRLAEAIRGYEDSYDRLPAVRGAGTTARA